MSHTELDARRLLCPMPVIKTQNHVAKLSAGDTVTVTCTDPGVLSDIPAWSRINGHEVVDTLQQDGEILITVRVGA
jgi:tRNA 2-thiouridine synthesizing protein A